MVTLRMGNYTQQSLASEMTEFVLQADCRGPWPDRLEPSRTGEERQDFSRGSPQDRAGHHEELAQRQNGGGAAGARGCRADSRQ